MPSAPRHCWLGGLLQRRGSERALDGHQDAREGRVLFSEQRGGHDHQVNVLGHDHPGEEFEAVLESNRGQVLDEPGAGVRFAEQLLAAVTREVDQAHAAVGRPAPGTFARPARGRSGPGLAESANGTRLDLRADQAVPKGNRYHAPRLSFIYSFLSLIIIDKCHLLTKMLLYLRSTYELCDVDYNLYVPCITYSTT